MDAVYKIEGVDYETFLKSSNVLYVRKINDRLEARICQTFNIDPDHVNCGKRDQFLALVLLDTATGRWFSLRLSSARKVWKWISKLKFDESRHLNFIEQLIVRRCDKERLREESKND